MPGPDTVRYGGNTACVEVRCGEEIIILDAGTGIRELGKALARELGASAGRLWILITHTHWDHIQGFPFFAPAYLARQSIRILGWRGSRSGLRRTVAASVESPFFPVALPQMPGAISVQELRASRFAIGPVDGRAARIHHPGGGVAFRLDTPAGSIVYAPDHEVVDPDALGRPPSPARPKNGSTGSRRAHDLRDLIRGADILIHDAQYTAAEYAERVGWGHSCVDAVVRQAAAANVKHLLLFHHDPDRTDAQVDAMLNRARALGKDLNPLLKIDAAREGLELRLRTAAYPSRIATAAA
ncbi:MAG: MBL fold metallo-hydrolase [Verrucomicrobiales bacterium]|nr:MBL fold metallo-hydrolase [Verrucomicrobiales bacterium]